MEVKDLESLAALLEGYADELEAYGAPVQAARALELVERVDDLLVIRSSRGRKPSDLVGKYKGLLVEISAFVSERASSGAVRAVKSALAA